MRWRKEARETRVGREADAKSSALVVSIRYLGSNSATGLLQTRDGLQSSTSAFPRALPLRLSSIFNRCTRFDECESYDGTMAQPLPPPSRTGSVGPPSAGGMGAPPASAPVGGGNNQQNLNQIVSGALLRVLSRLSARFLAVKVDLDTPQCSRRGRRQVGGGYGQAHNGIEEVVGLDDLKERSFSMRSLECAFHYAAQTPYVRLPVSTLVCPLPSSV